MFEEHFISNAKQRNATHLQAGAWRGISGGYGAANGRHPLALTEKTGTLFADQSTLGTGTHMKKWTVCMLRAAGQEGKEVFHKERECTSKTLPIQ
eukprot:scaffold239379_cov17-Tisochrysis_lutea.AAC.1